MHYPVFGASLTELPAEGLAFQVDDGRKGVEGTGSGGWQGAALYGLRQVTEPLSPGLSPHLPLAL